MAESLRKFGFELEYASHAADMVTDLFGAGLMRTDMLHDYHCTCMACSYAPGPVFDAQHHYHDGHCDSHGCWMSTSHDCGLRGCPRRLPQNVVEPLPPADLRAQRDSTADGEFITRPLTDWDDLRRIAAALTTAATTHGANASARCGLHVHVDTSTDLPPTDPRGYPVGEAPIPARQQRRRIVPAAYLAFERYFTEIVAPGSSVRKRDMNSTLMQAVRQHISDNYGQLQPEMWMDMGRSAVDDLMLAAIARDRHVDLNWNRRHFTWEFRVFNATNAPWRIELACRMAVAFVEAAPRLREAVEGVVRGSKFWPEGCDSPWGEIVRPAFKDLTQGHPTKRPIVPMVDFIDILCDADPDLRPLIERQANFMRTRYATNVEVAV